jgi:hypothetical protein
MSWSIYKHCNDGLTDGPKLLWVSLVQLLHGLPCVQPIDLDPIISSRDTFIGVNKPTVLIAALDPGVIGAGQCMSPKQQIAHQFDLSFLYILRILT